MMLAAWMEQIIISEASKGWERSRMIKYDQVEGVDAILYIQQG